MLFIASIITNLLLLSCFTTVHAEVAQACDTKTTQLINKTISEYLEKNSALSSKKFTTPVKRCVGDYALFKIHPEKAETDDAYVFLHKTKKWNVMSMGTYFDEDFLKKVPVELRNWH